MVLSCSVTRFKNIVEAVISSKFTKMSRCVDQKRSPFWRIESHWCKEYQKTVYLAFCCSPIRLHTYHLKYWKFYVATLVYSSLNPVFLISTASLYSDLSRMASCFFINAFKSRDGTLQARQNEIYQNRFCNCVERNEFYNLTTFIRNKWSRDCLETNWFHIIFVK